MKICCVCKIQKELINFCKNKNSRDGKSYQCKQCAKLYRDNNKDKSKNYKSKNKEYKKNYYLNNKEHINYLRRLKYKNNENIKIKSNQANKNRLLKESEDQKYKRLESYKEYYNLNKDKINLLRKKYRKENKEYINLKNRKRKKLLKENNIKQKDINNLLYTYNNKCVYCNIDVERGVNLHLDHKIPLIRGGTHTIDNLAPSCNVCNLKKATKTYEEFIKISINSNNIEVICLLNKAN